MGADDKVKNAAQDMGGKLKEGLGKATGDDRQIAEGKADQTSASVKKAGENIKDAIKG